MLPRSFCKKFDFLGYFTLATKILTLKQSSLPKTECKAIARFGYFDEDSQSYKLPAALIAQFSRNFNESSKSISGDDLMDIALNKIFALNKWKSKSHPVILWFLQKKSTRRWSRTGVRMEADTKAEKILDISLSLREL